MDEVLMRLLLNNGCAPTCEAASGGINGFALGSFEGGTRDGPAFIRVGEVETTRVLRCDGARTELF